MVDHLLDRLSAPRASGSYDQRGGGGSGGASASASPFRTSGAAAAAGTTGNSMFFPGSGAASPAHAELRPASSAGGCIPPRPQQQQQGAAAGGGAMSAAQQLAAAAAAGGDKASSANSSGGGGLPGFRKDVSEDRHRLVALLLHAADLSSPLQAPALDRKLAQQVSAEFARQAEAERAAGVAVTVLDASTPLGLATMEMGFVTFICRPLFHVLTRAVTDLSFLVERVDSSIAMWSKMRMEALKVEGPQAEAARLRKQGAAGVEGGDTWSGDDSSGSEESDGSSAGGYSGGGDAAPPQPQPLTAAALARAAKENARAAAAAAAAGGGSSRPLPQGGAPAPWRWPGGTSPVWERFFGGGTSRSTVEEEEEQAARTTGSGQEESAPPLTPAPPEPGSKLARARAA